MDDPTAGRRPDSPRIGLTKGSVFMLVESFAQARFALSLLFGIPFDPGSLERLAEALRQTRHEFGTIGPEAAELLRGPELDESTRREVQLRRFRTQASRAARETPYYRDLFGRL